MVLSRPLEQNDPDILEKKIVLSRCPMLYTLSEVRVLQSIQKFALGYSIIHLDFPCHRTLRRSPESTKFVPGLHDLLQFQFDFSSDIHRLGQMMARENGFRFPL